MLFRQIAFVLGGEIHAPVHRVFELLTAIFQNGDRVSVIHLSEIRGNETLQTIDRIFINAFGKELHVICPLFQNGFENVLQHRFRQTCHIVQISKGDFRLQHPELCQVAGGVGVFRTEGWAEGVDFG